MRKKLIYWLFEHSQRMYIKFKNKTPWGITSQDLLTYPKESFGFHLGKLLTENNFELLPKVERHDCYHLLTGYGTKVEDEIALQYVCFGNGKRSPYLIGVLLVGTIILPDYYKYYIKSYKLGKNCNQFHHFNYKNILHFSFQEIREGIFNTEQILQIR
jgi:ubiquinone biosynthesis protein Coq4